MFIVFVVVHRYVHYINAEMCIYDDDEKSPNIYAAITKTMRRYSKYKCVEESEKSEREREC